MQNLLQNKVLWGLVLTFVIAGLGGITGIVSPTASMVITLIVSGLTTLGHSVNVIKGSK